jgi:hypothetical protein
MLSCFKKVAFTYYPVTDVARARKFYEETLGLKAGSVGACARHNPRSLEYVGITAALYLHLGPFSRFVMTSLKKQIGQIDAGQWCSPLGDTPRAINAARVPAAASA